MYDTTLPSGETDYLAKAADLLAKAAEANERQHVRFPHGLAEGRERIAQRYAELGAIQRGLLPAALVERILDQINEPS